MSRDGISGRRVSGEIEEGEESCHSIEEPKPKSGEMNSPLQSKEKMEGKFAYMGAQHAAPLRRKSRSQATVTSGLR